MGNSRAVFQLAQELKGYFAVFTFSEGRRHPQFFTVGQDPPPHVSEHSLKSLEVSKHSLTSLEVSKHSLQAWLMLVSAHKPSGPTKLGTE